MSCRGSSLVDAIVGAALAGAALAVIAAAAGVASQGLRLSRDTSAGVALARERLEVLRAGFRADGSDTAVSADGTRFTRVWRVEGGRGAPARLTVRVVWGRRALSFVTEAMP
jgi:hypothetical protein